MYYRGAQAAIVVYDIQNQDSFQRAKTWVKELQRQVSTKHILSHNISNNLKNTNAIKSNTYIVLLISFFGCTIALNVLAFFRFRS